jgi:FkbM family methyltransferase
MKSKFKQFFLTNLFFENLFIFFLKRNITIVKRFLPSNESYKKNSIRIVKRHGIKFSLDIFDYQEYLIYYYLENDTSKIVLNYLPIVDGSIVDIGANIGQTSLWIAQYLIEVEAEILAFEPYPSTFIKLQSNINLNDFNNIKVFNLALGNSNSEIDMVEDYESNSGGYKILSESDIDSNKKKKTTVKQVKLDQFKDQLKKVNLIKIDVEGYEFEVLSGANELIRKHKPYLFIELSDANLRLQNSSAENLLSLIYSMGYTRIVQSQTNIEIEKLNIKDCSMDIFCS